MKKAVITILGIQGADFKTGLVKDYNHQAKYYFENDENKFEYYNTLPLLMDRFSYAYKIVPIYTKEAKILNQDVLKYAKKEIEFDDDKLLIKDDKNYNAIFSQIDKIINEYDRVIIDVTHGFRHLPLLMLIDLMMINFNDNEKIEKILFAKEIEKHTPKDKGEYEIIDLKDYMDLANLNYVLTSFERNYTTAKIKTSNEEYNKFLDLLEEFSSNILANSLDTLGKSSNKYKSITDKLLTQINLILENDNSLLNNFKQNLLILKEHIQEIKDYNTKIDYEKLYLFSKNMNSKGYLLNSITLLSEAIGLYCKEKLKNINIEVFNFVEDYENKVILMKNSENKKYQLYPLSNQSKTIYKLGKDFNGDYLAIKNPNSKEKIFNDTSKKITKIIKNYISSIQNQSEYQKFKEMIMEIDILRNNLAHGNSSKRLKDVKNDIDMLLKQFESEIKKFKPIQKTKITSQKEEIKPKSQLKIDTEKKVKKEEKYKPSGLGNSFKFKGFDK